MGKFGEYFKSAIKQIISNGYRTAMTMLGIVIGIAAVIAVVSLGNGMSHFVTSQLNDIAGNYGNISIDSSKTSETFTKDDMDLLEEAMPDIKGVSPDFSVYGKVVGRRETYSAYVSGGTESLEYSYSNGIVKGRYFTRQQVDSNQRVCVMLLDDAKKIFGTEDAIGLNIDITIWGKTATYTVVGLRENMNRMYSFLMEGQDYSATIEIPYTSLGADFDIYVDNFYSMVVTFCFIHALILDLIIFLKIGRNGFEKLLLALLFIFLFAPIFFLFYCLYMIFFCFLFNNIFPSCPLLTI